MQKLNALKDRLNDVHNLRTAMGLLGWDQQTCMPPGGCRCTPDETSLSPSR